MTKTKGKKKPQTFESENQVLSDEIPIINSISMMKLPNMDNNGWVVLKIKTQGDNVLEIKPSEPNLKQITMEQAKIAFVKMFMSNL